MAIGDVVKERNAAVRGLLVLFCSDGNDVAELVAANQTLAVLAVS